MTAKNSVTLQYFVESLIFLYSYPFKKRRCSGSGRKRSCTDYFIHWYTYEILCTNQTNVFHKDCENTDAFSLTVALKYLDSGASPQYNCLINTQNTTCASLCAKLLTSYKLVLVQRDTNNNQQVQSAWTGLSKCSNKPNMKLTYDSTINPCSSGARIKIEFFILIVSLIKSFL